MLVVVVPPPLELPVLELPVLLFTATSEVVVEVLPALVFPALTLALRTSLRAEVAVICVEAVAVVAELFFEADLVFTAGLLAARFVAEENFTLPLASGAAVARSAASSSLLATATFFFGWSPVAPATLIRAGADSAGAAGAVPPAVSAPSCRAISFSMSLMLGSAAA